MKIGITRREKISSLREQQRLLKGRYSSQVSQTGGGTSTSYIQDVSGATIKQITIQPISFTTTHARQVKKNSLKEQQRLLKASARKLNKRMLLY